MLHFHPPRRTSSRPLGDTARALGTLSLLLAAALTPVATPAQTSEGGELPGIRLGGEPNDNCNQAITIQCGQTLQGTTQNAIADNVPACGTTNQSPGVWYVLTSPGGQVNFSTCNQAAFDTQLSVYSGTCTNLSCLGGTNDSPGCGTTTDLTLSTTANTDYYIFVHGFGTGLGSIGAFSLSVTCNVPVELQGFSIE